MMEEYNQEKWDVELYLYMSRQLVTVQEMMIDLIDEYMSEKSLSYLANKSARQIYNEAMRADDTSLSYDRAALEARCERLMMDNERLFKLNKELAEAKSLHGYITSKRPGRLSVQIQELD